MIIGHDRQNALSFSVLALRQICQRQTDQALVAGAGIAGIAEFDPGAAMCSRLLEIVRFISRSS